MDNLWPQGFLLRLEDITCAAHRQPATEYVLQSIVVQINKTIHDFKVTGELGSEVQLDVSGVSEISDLPGGVWQLIIVDRIDRRCIRITFDSRPLPGTAARRLCDLRSRRK